MLTELASGRKLCMMTLLHNERDTSGLYSTILNDRAMNVSHIIISSVDYRRLAPLCCGGITSETTPRERLALKAVLDQAQVLEPSEMPSDVVTMNSTVRLRDLDTNEVEVYTVVYPGFTDTINNRVSVLAAMGTAILGYRVGDVIVRQSLLERWNLRVEAVEYQPERAGQYDT